MYKMNSQFLLTKNKGLNVIDHQISVVDHQFFFYLYKKKLIQIINTKKIWRPTTLIWCKS